jgi:hypothetical protein
MMEPRSAGAGLCLLLASACVSPDLAGPSADPMDRRVEAALRGQDAPHVYAMRSPNQSVEQARAMANFWIRQNLEQAFAYKRQGQMEGASFHLAMARYTLRRATFPAANDMQGNPAVFRGQPSGSRTHYWRDQADQDIQAMFEKQSVPAGDLLRMYGIDTDEGPRDRPNQLPRPNL